MASNLFSILVDLDWNQRGKNNDELGPLRERTVRLLSFPLKGMAINLDGSQLMSLRTVDLMLFASDPWVLRESGTPPHYDKRIVMKNELIRML